MVDPRPEYGEAGVTGTTISAGQVIRNDDNAWLQGREWALIADQMRREDTNLSAFSWALGQTILSASFSFQVRDDASPLALEARDYANTAFGVGGEPGVLEGGFEHALDMFVPFLDVGFRYVEELYIVEGGKVWLKKYADRLPSAHYRWEQDSAEHFTGVTQFAPRGDTPFIPAEKLLLLTLRRQGDDYEGVGLLRPCYKWWKLKRLCVELLEIGCDRMAVPTPLLETNVRQMVEDGGVKQTDIVAARTNVENQLAALISHERVYLKTVPGLTISTYAPGDSFDPMKLLGVISACDEQMASAYLMGFLRLGVTDTGARAVGDVQETFYRRAAVNILDKICSAIGGASGPGTGTLGRLLAWNFPTLPIREYPKLTHKGLHITALQNLIAQLPALKGAGFIQPSVGLENAILAEAGQPPLSAEQEQQRASVAAPTPGSLMREALRHA